MSYRDLAELRLAAAHHFAPLGGHAHFNCTLCQVAIRERVRQEQLAEKGATASAPTSSPRPETAYASVITLSASSVITLHINRLCTVI